jgi:mono/diheme cytochrome c family protein
MDASSGGAVRDRRWRGNILPENAVCGLGKMDRTGGGMGIAKQGIMAWAALCLLAASASADEAGRVAQGEYLMRAGDCMTCHTDEKGGGKPFAGGRALATPFGTFYSPNLTPDKETGIGGWSDADFLNALKRGIDDDGANLFPPFPYTSYTRITDADALSIRAYLASLTPVHQPNKPHNVKPFAWRFPVTFWKWLFFTPGDFQPDPKANAELNRGAYLVTALAHCAECHTPRNLAGGLKTSMLLAGTVDGPEGERAPNITPDKETGIGKWSQSDLVHLLKTGIKPDFDNVQGTMALTVRDGLSHLSDADLNAIARYILSRPPIVNRVPRKSDK